VRAAIAQRTNFRSYETKWQADILPKKFGKLSIKKAKQVQLDIRSNSYHSVSSVTKLSNQSVKACRMTGEAVVVPGMWQRFIDRGTSFATSPRAAVAQRKGKGCFNQALELDEIDAPGRAPINQRLR
jgi:hypothetical protein